MQDSPLISLLIVTKDRKDALLRTLRAMVPALSPEHEVIVFDNRSSDDTAAAVAREFPGVKLIVQREEIPYIAARNRLLGIARGEYAISLDDDAEIITPDFVPVMLDHFKNHATCGVIGFSIFWGVDLPERITAPAEKPRRVASFVGCGHAWRLEAWRAIPEYPEWFEFYGEEDFAALQLLRSGWEVHYVPQIVVHHRVDFQKRRSNKVERLWRYGRHFRSGIFVMLLFYPLTALPRRLAYVIWMQVRQRLLKQHDWRVVPVWLWMMGKIAGNAHRIWRSRTALGASQWKEWNTLAPAIIYWEPATETESR
jgi:glycosyltransferase involved in cell wall biosynthesis